MPSAAAPGATGTVQIAARTVRENGRSGPGGLAARLAIADIVKLPDQKASLPDAAKPAEARKRKGPVQIFVSRKTGRLYVRQDFTPLFDTPVTIADPDKPGARMCSRRWRSRTIKCAGTH